MARVLRGASALLCLVVLSAADADTSTKAVAAVPVATFADQPTLTDLVLSPDGKQIAARATLGGTPKLFVFKADDLTTVRRIDLGEAKVTDIKWAGPGRLLLTAATTIKIFNAPFPVTRLYSVELAAGRVSILDPNSRGLWAGDVLYTDPAGGWILVSSQDDLFSAPSVKRVDLPSGRVTRIEKERGDVWNWFADESGVVRAGIAYDNNRWTMWYRDKPGDPLKAIHGRSKANGDDGAVDGLWVLAGTSSGIIVTNAQTGRFAAYRYDFNTGSIGDPVYQNADVDVTGIVQSAHRGTVDGVSYEDDRRRVAWLNPEMATLQKRIDRAFPSAENVVMNGSADGSRLLVWTGGAADPGRYYLFDRASNTMDLKVVPYEKLSGVKLSPVTPIRYAARDGLSIPGYLTLPRDRPDHDLPLILFPHGGPFARDSWEYDPYVQFLASRGYAVLQPQFRGSTGYGKAFVERGYGQWGRAMQDDIDDGIDWLVKSGQVDPKRVCIMGISYGGYAALWGAIRNPERYRCAVSLSGVTDLPAMLRYDRRSFSAPRYYKAWQSRVKGENQIDLDTVSPLAQAARLTIPVLIAHGEKDDIVPPKQAHQMVKALEGQRARVESVFYPLEGHGIRKPENLADFLARLDAFLAKNNPA
jgi:dipeptidyl aminopeptidase/acylaminoacyl peptidase